MWAERPYAVGDLTRRPGDRWSEPSVNSLPLKTPAVTPRSAPSRPCVPHDPGVQHVRVQVETGAALPPDQLAQRLLALVVDELTENGSCIVAVRIDVSGSPPELW